MKCQVVDSCDEVRCLLGAVICCSPHHARGHPACVQWVPARFPKAMKQERDAEQSPPSQIEVNAINDRESS